LRSENENNNDERRRHDLHRTLGIARANFGFKFAKLQMVHGFSLDLNPAGCQNLAALPIWLVNIAKGNPYKV
jgi:hypothetical protein